MRVLQWAFPYLPTMGGREVFIQRMARTLMARGHHVHVIAPPPAPTEVIAPDYVEEEEFPILRYDAQRMLFSKNPQAMFLLREALISELEHIDPKIMHIHNAGPEVVVLRDALRAARLHPKIIYTQHGLTDDSVIGRHALSMASAVVAVSHHVNDSLLNTHPSISHKLTTIHNGVPIPATTTPVNHESKSVLAFGRLCEEKGFHVLLDAWSQLLRVHDDFILTIAGDGPSAHALARQARDLGINEAVEFTGWCSQQQIHELIDAARIVVMPSIWEEPFGLSAAEAQAQGRPVIASDVGGLSKIIQHQRTGLLVPPHDSDALYIALRNLIADVDTLRSMGEQGQLRAAEKFNWEKCIDEYERLYLELAHQDG